LCAEIYDIDHQPAVFYKIINWWYDCLPEECDWLCGKTVTYTYLENVRIGYDEVRMTLRLRMDDGFADQLSLFKPGKPCAGPSQLQCTRLNGKYFGKGRAARVSDWNGFVFDNIAKAQARLLESMRKDISLVLEGKIGGLQNDGKIALHPADTFLRNCPRVSEDPSIGYPIRLNIVHAGTNEKMATYRAVWEK